MAEKFKLEETSAGTKWWDQAINRNNKKVEDVINTIIDNDSSSGVANAELVLKVTELESSLEAANSHLNDIVQVNSKNHASLQEAIDYAKAHNLKKVYVPYDTLSIESTIIVDFDLELEGDDTLLMQNADVPMFIFNGGFEWTHQITSYSKVYVTLPNAGSSTRITRIYPSIMPTVTVNDEVRIFSRLADETNGIGETAKVISVGANYIDLNVTLREDYTAFATANSVPIYISKVKDINFKMTGFKFSTDINQSWFSEYIRVNFANSFKLENFKVLQGHHVFVNLNACSSYDIRNGEINNLKNNVSGGNIGYGINDGSSNGLVTNVRFFNVRHGYTTNMYKGYGKVYNALISNCIGISCTNAPFDTHKDCENITFSNCKVYGSVTGNQSSGSAFQARGKDIKFINCIAEKSQFGFYLFEEADQVYLENCKAKDIVYRAFLFTASDTNKYCKVTDSYFNSLEYDTTFTVNEGTCYLFNVTISNKSDSDSSRCLLAQAEAVINFDNLNLLMKDFSGTNGRFIYIATGSKIYGKTLALSQGSASLNNLFVGDNSANTTLDVKAISGDFTIGGIANIQTTKLEYINDSKTINSAIITQTVGSSGISAKYSISNKHNPVIILNITTTNSATMGGFPLGSFAGQLMLVTNINTSDYTLTLQTATGISLSSSIVIPANGSALLVFDGTNWRNN